MTNGFLRIKVKMETLNLEQAISLIEDGVADLIEQKILHVRDDDASRYYILRYDNGFYFELSCELYNETITRF